jgi:hypothetical protein
VVRLVKGEWASQIHWLRWLNTSPAIV